MFHPPFPTALHTGWSTRYPISLYGTPLPPSPQHCTPGVLHGTPPTFMEHPSPLPHSTAHHVYYTVAHQPLWNTPPPFPTALHTGWSTRYPTSLYGTPLPPFPTGLHTGWSTRYPTSLYGTPLPPFPTGLHTGWSTRYPTSLYGTPLPPSPQHCTPGGLQGTPPAFMEHPSPLPHSTAHQVYYTVPHQPLWNTPPPFPTALHTGWSTRYPTSLYGTPLPTFPTGQHTGWSTRYPTSLYGTPLPPSPQHCTPGGLHGSPPAFMEHPSPLPHNTAHRVVYTVPHQPLWNTPPPFPTALHTRCTTRYPTSLHGTPLPPSPQHCTPGGLHGSPPAFMEHPSPLPHSTAPRVVYMVPHQPLWNTAPPLPHSTTQWVVYMVPHQPLWNTPPPLPHITAHRVVYTVPRKPF